jgi:hypothetical protein
VPTFSFFFFLFLFFFAPQEVFSVPMEMTAASLSDASTSSSKFCRLEEMMFRQGTARFRGWGETNIATLVGDLLVY